MIELDCYDGPKGTPIVTHGGTACKPVELRECLQAIKEFGFVKTPYPVIVTFENHVNVEQRGVMGDLLEEIFCDGMLYRPPEGAGKKEEWPSPNQLKGKVVIRDKLKHKQDAKKGKNGSGKEKKAKKEKPAVLDTSKTLAPDLHKSIMDNEDDEESDDDDNDGEVVEESNVADKLKNVVAIGNAKFHGFDEAQEWPGVKSCSWNEKKVEKMRGHLAKSN